MRRAAILVIGCLFAPMVWQEAAAPAAEATSPTAAQRSSGTPQRASTRERFKLIQQALSERGYNPGPIDGRWGSKSSAALKRFEKDHNLPADGRLDSLALITLGLGPESASAEPAPGKEETNP